MPIADALAIISLLLAIGSYLLYIWKPAIQIKAELKDTHIVATVKNRGCWRKARDVECEIVVSEQRDFDQSKTLELRKSKTLTILPRGEFYRFVASKPLYANGNAKKYRYVRVRVTASNAIGIRKHFEAKYLIEHGNLVSEPASKNRTQ